MAARGGRMRNACLLILVFLLGHGSVAFADEPESALDRIAILVERLEANETGTRSRVAGNEIEKEMTQGAEALARHLQENPDDVRALILAARLGRLRVVAEGVVLTPAEQPAPRGASFAPLQDYLDHALTLQPKNAEAHYWKARLYGVREPVVRDDRMYFQSIDIDRALASARVAVKLAPDRVAYREALALDLVEAQRPGEALEVMQPLAAQYHPIWQLLDDLEAVPVPESAIFSPEDSESFAQLQMSRGRFSDYPQLRTRVYVLEMSAATVEAFFADRWGGFRFFFFTEKRGSKASMRAFTQYLSNAEGELEPAEKVSEIPAQPGSGIALQLTEFNAASPEVRLETPAGHKLPSDIGSSFCMLFIINFRRFD